MKNQDDSDKINEIKMLYERHCRIRKEAEPLAEISGCKEKNEKLDKRIKKLLDDPELSNEFKLNMLKSFSEIDDARLFNYQNFISTRLLMFEIHQCFQEKRDEIVNDLAFNKLHMR
jgi:uncharacterized coiled-coil DUF342 family protein